MMESATYEWKELRESMELGYYQLLYCRYCPKVECEVIDTFECLERTHEGYERLKLK